MRHRDSLGCVQVAGRDQVHADLFINSTTTLESEFAVADDETTELQRLAVAVADTAKLHTLDVAVEVTCVDCELFPIVGAFA